MDRNREARRASIVGSNGFNRRKHRTNSLRDSPDEDGGVELQESTKLRDRVKKDRDRDRERGRDLRERVMDRDLRERSGSRSKRRRAERLMNNRDEIGRDETSDESDNDDLDEEYEETTTSTTSSVAGVRFPPTAVGSISNHHHGHVSSHHQHYNHNSGLGEQQQNTSNSTITNNHMISGNHNLQHRKNFPPISSSSSKVYRTATPVWKPGDEMIGVSVPRKARSASTKRLQDWASSSSHNNSGGVTVGDQNLRQASNSPVRTGLVSTSTPSPAPPMSPSSSNASARKKLKHGSGNSNGPKLKPTKASLKPSSTNPPEELEIEIAEVLYVMSTQSQAPSSKKEDLKEVNRSTGDSKSRASPSISNTSSANNPIPEPNSTPLSAVAPKRKRPRQVLENSSHGSRPGPKPEMDQIPKSEISPLNLEIISGSIAENGYAVGGNLVNSQVQPAQPPEEPESMKLESESKPVAAEVLKETSDLVATEEASPQKERESAAVRTEDFNGVDSASIATDSVSATEIKENPVEPGIENPRQEKFQIDLMAPPPQVRSSPERDNGIDSGAHVVDEKPVLSVLDIGLKSGFLKGKENENGKRCREVPANVAAEEKKGRVMEQGSVESEKRIENKVMNTDLKLDLANGEKDGLNSTGNRAFKPGKEESLTEKTGQSTSPLPLPMSMASWPGGLPPIGYMAPFQGVVPMDGTTVPPKPLQQSFGQPRPKRCATHCFIARNIHSLQQFLKMNPFFTPPAVGSTALYASKPFSHNFAPASDMQNVTVRGVHNAQDEGQSVASVQNHGGVKENVSQSASTPDSAQRKQQQILIQQALPSVPPSNLMAPTFIFPLNQQQAAMAAASARPTTGKSSNGATSATAMSSNVSNSAVASAPVPAGGATNPMNFSYPNMPVNETQYLAILQNNGYPFTIPAVGPPTNYRGTTGQAMPFGSFYPSQMIHPSQIQPPSNQIPQNTASGNSSSQKNSQRSQPGNSNPQNFPSQKPQQVSQLPQASQNQQRQQQQQRNHENETGSEDSPSANLRASVNIYGQNFTMPMHPQNYAMVTPPSGSGNQSEKKPQQAQQPPHSFAMSFGSINGAIPGMGIDLASMAQNHAFFQSFPEAARQNIQMMAAAQVAQKKNFRISEDCNNSNNNNKSGGGDTSANDDERKNSKGQSIAFTRSDLADPSTQASTVAESSPRPAPTRNSQAMNSNVPNAHIQSQTQQQQMMQLMQHRQQQLVGNSGNNNRNKSQVSSNSGLYTEHLNSSTSSMAAKFPNAISGFPQNLVQSNSNSNGPNHSPPWKSSSRTPPTSQAQSSLASSNASTIKNLPQQHNSQIRPQMHSQISFAGSQKRSTNSPGHAPPSNSPAPSATVSKGAGGSPRMTSSTSANKMGQAQSSALSAQQAQNSQAQKSLSILGNPSTGKQQSQQQIPKNMQQAQLFFSNPYTQAQSPHSTGSNSGPGGYFMQQRRRPEQQQQAAGGPGASSNGMLSLGGTGTNDPAKAIAAATSNLKGGGLPTQGMMHAAAQFAAQSSGMVLPAGFAYVHPVPNAVQVKPAEQKQPAGQPEKK